MLETKNENQLKLRRKRQNTTPTEVGKNAGKSPLLIREYSCSHVQGDIVIFSQNSDSPQKPPKHLTDPCRNNHEQESKQIQSERSSRSRNGRAFAKFKFGKLNHSCKFIYPHHVNYETLNLIPCNKQKFINSQKSMPNLQSPKANQTWTLICTMQLIELTRQQHNRGDGNPKTPDCCTHKFWIATHGGIKQSRLHHSHKASLQGKHNLILLQNYPVSFNNNNQKMP